ncbi:MAG: hypothetical protein NC548_35015 [Lachnospiraceae bacterium]|nr:hypothetical protein [Lachnospiraceae bacterium]
MKKQHKLFTAVSAVLLSVLCFAVGCGQNGELVEKHENDKDFSEYRSASAQENAYEYRHFYLPEKDAGGQGYVGDTMPYYENGKYYVYYLKEGGDSYNHSAYLASTTDFVTWEETQASIIEADHGSAQDSWVGTGSVVKVGSKYYFFYTGHTFSQTAEYKETIMVAEGDSLTSFTQKEGWQILPDASLGQKQDFRDPQAYYDAASDTITLTVTASQSGVARIVKYTLKGDLSNVQYGGIIFTNPVSETVDCYNLECSDTFKIGDKWYLTFSAQDDTLWYTSSDTQYGVYTQTPKRLDGKLFYAAKHASDGENTYLIGWARRSESVSSTQDVNGWAGNMIAQKVVSDGKGGIILAPIDAYMDASVGRKLLCGSDVEVKKDDYVSAFTCQERYVVTGEFSYSGSGDFGLAFDYNARKDKYKLISFSPEKQTLSLTFNLGDTLITEVPVLLSAGETYSFTYIQEGSVGVMYLNGQIALTVRLYGVSGKAVMLYSEGSNVTFTNLKQFTYA